jgi:hypothetical protein
MTKTRPGDAEIHVQRHVEALCVQFGLLYYHTHDSRNSPAGFLDVVVAGPGGLLFAELKSATGRLSAAQKRWVIMLTSLGCNVAVWSPVEMRSGAIARQLQTLRKAPAHA